MKNRRTLFFTDLEGTILRDSDGKFDELDFYDLVTELSEMGNLTDSTVEIRLVSPIGFKRMDIIVDKMDTVIARSFKGIGQNSNVKLVEAVASPFDIREDVTATKRLSRKIMALPKVTYSPDIAREAKRRYLNYVFESYKDNSDIVLSIYAGNDRNDIDAMGVVKSKKNGFTVCPQNSIEQIKGLSDFVSDKSDILGVIEGISKINENIRKRVEVKEKGINYEKEIF